MSSLTEAEANSSRVALVTGGSRGIGLACAKTLAEAGYRVAVTYNATPPTAAESAGLLAVRCDVSASADVDAAFYAVEERLGPVTVLVANAGITRDNLLMRMSEEEFAEVLETNLFGSFRAVKRAMRPMMRARWGRVVLISSIVAQTGLPGQSNYAASKSALLGLARSVAKEYASRNITVNVVSPGPVDTDMLGKLSSQRLDEMAARVPMGRIGSVSDVADVVGFLVSEQAGYITGAVIPVDGGMHMGNT